MNSLLRLMTIFLLASEGCPPFFPTQRCAPATPANCRWWLSSWAVRSTTFDPNGHANVAIFVMVVERSLTFIFLATQRLGTPSFESDLRKRSLRSHSLRLDAIHVGDAPTGMLASRFYCALHWLVAEPAPVACGSTSSRDLMLRCAGRLEMVLLYVYARLDPKRLIAGSATIVPRSKSRSENI